MPVKGLIIIDYRLELRFFKKVFGICGDFLQFDVEQMNFKTNNCSD
jgi:hypothetical protein